MAQKWEAKVSAALPRPTPDQIWPFFKDFFNFHKWFPSLSTCYGIHGANGELGCIRFCSGGTIPTQNGEDQVSWSKERLIAIDPVNKSLSYEIVECNIGFNSYISTIKIRPIDEGKDGCLIEWLFAADPVEGLKLEDLVSKYEVGLNCMAKNMKDALASSRESPELTNTKWEGKSSSKVKGTTAEQVWPFLEDYCNLHKWISGLNTCYRVEGTDGQPGLIRYCDTMSGEGDQASVKWVHERLVTIDPVQRCLSYEIVANNMGFKSYVATLRVTQIEEDDDQCGCQIEWSFVADPIEGATCEDFSRFIDITLQGMAERMAKAASHSDG